MFTVSHRVARSEIHGLGVFTCEAIAAGALVWRYDPMFDVEIPLGLLDCFPLDVVETLHTHAEYIPHLGVFRLGNDGDIFMNHSDTPTLLDHGDVMRAARDIPAGSELTCNYADVQVLAYESAIKNNRTRAAA